VDLSSSTVRPQRSLTFACLFFTPLYLNSFQPRPSFFYVVFFFSLFLSLYRCVCFDINLFLIISFSRKAFILFTVSTPYDMSFISLFVLILQRSPPLIGQCIFLTIFRSDILSAFISYIVVIQVFGPSVSMGHIRVLYSFNLVLRDSNCDLKSLICSSYA
jgi:hypothetical protein